MKLRAPIPYYGGKSSVAPAIWQRFGDPMNLVDPFMGSLATLWQRPYWSVEDGRFTVGNPYRIETVNDAFAFIANLFRAIKHDPDGVAHYADNPVNHADLSARHAWLVGYVPEPKELPAEINTPELEAAYRLGWRNSYNPDSPYGFIERVRSDPDYYDVKRAGWYAWGQSCWIGSGFCEIKETASRVSLQRPHLGDAGMGINRPSQQIPEMAGRRGVLRAALNMPSRQVPRLSGVQGDSCPAPQEQRPHLRPHQGIQAQRKPINQRVDLPQHSGEQGILKRPPTERQDLYAYMRALSDRLRYVRVVCGDWTQVTGPSVTYLTGKTAVLLDPPYNADASRQGGLYAHDDLSVSTAVREWALANGDNPLMLIALCGYEREHGRFMPDTWECYRWKTNGGYGNQRKSGKNGNNEQECIWFSPHCIRPDAPYQLSLLETPRNY